MKNKYFNIDNLPEVIEFSNGIITNELDKFKENYRLLIDDEYKILNFCLENNLSKPNIYYHLCFYIEISLKYFLLVYSDDLNIGEIEKCGHDIHRLIDLAKKYTISMDKLQNLLNELYDKEGKVLDLSKYFNYKYNKAIGDPKLILEYEINSNEKNVVKEVIKCLKCLKSII
jgi:hypothetical protein